MCFVPMACILPRFFGIDGILYAAPAADCIAMAVTGSPQRRVFPAAMKKSSLPLSESAAILKPSRPGAHRYDRQGTRLRGKADRERGGKEIRDSFLL